ncbi:hypothetical protein DB347_24620 [Opitutaceae bacterium EW11]|nr:hypothetical protein DB347_24620 [Opitutaceae bacterium EW11]
MRSPSASYRRPSFTTGAASPRSRGLLLGLAMSSVLSAPRAQADVPASPFRVGGLDEGELRENDLARPSLPAKPAPMRRELFFVDAAVADPTAFWLAAPAGATVLCIPRGVDSWRFMADQAEHFRELAAIHLVSHGEPGAIVLNGCRYTEGDLSAHGADLRRLGRALRKNGDLLVYGCDTGAGREGRQLVNQLSEITGADVGASMNPTGGAAGADWKLEIVHGQVETEPVAPAGYQHVLANFSVNTVASLRLALQTAASNNEADTITLTGNIAASGTPVDSGPDGRPTLAVINVSDGQAVTIDGAGYSLDAGHYGRAVYVPSSANVTIQNLTIKNGLLYGNGGNSGDPSLSQAVNGGSALGAGIYNLGTLTLGSVTLTANKAAGGGGGGGVANADVGGGGGGGGGFSGIGGGNGGQAGGYTGGTGAGGTGGNGGGYVPNAMGGRGGSSTGGAGGTNASGYSYGSAGGTATNGSISIGGGGGGDGWNAVGGAGGGAAGGIYNGVGGTIMVIGTSVLSNNLGAGGGGGGGGGNTSNNFNGGNGGQGVGAVWNRGTFRITASNYSAMTGNAAGSGAGGLENSNAVSGTTPASVSGIYNDSGTVDTNYTPNTAPTFVGATTSLSIYQNASATSVAGLLHVSDTDSSQTEIWSQSSAPSHGTLTISSATASSGSSDITPGGTIAYTPTTGYSGSDSFVIQVSDGTATATRTISVTITNPISLSTSGGTTSFTEGNNTTSTPVAVDTGLTVSDANSAVLASATVSISGGFQSAQDVLAFTNDGSTMGNVTGSYNAGTGVLTLTSSGATATLAQWQAALRSVTYSNSSDAPDTTSRTIGFAVNDGNVTSTTATKTVSITAVNDSPVVGTSGGSTSFQEGNNISSTPVAVDGALTVSDADNTTLSSASVAITGNFQSAEDILAFTNDGSTMGNIAGSYNAGTGVLTLTSSGATATLTQWQAALRSVTYTNTSNTPNTSTRTIGFTLNDGTSSSATSGKTVTIAAVDDAPIATTTGGTTAFVEGNNVTSTPVAVDAGITVSDTDNTTLAAASVTLTGNFQSGEDVLAFTNDGSTMGNITGSYNAGTGVLTLTSAGATATLAQWQSALRSVTYTNASEMPNTSTRVVTFLVNDGTANSSSVTKNVSVAATDDAPVVTVSGGSAAFVEGNNVTSTAVAVDSGISVSDLDNATLSSGSVSISGNFQSAEDSLQFVNDGSTMGNITGSYNAGTGVLTLTSSGATATTAQWQLALRSVAYTDSSESPNTATRTIGFTVNDGTASSSTVTRTVTITATDDAPTDIALSASSVNQSGGTDAPVGTLSSTDVDSVSFTYSLVSGTGSTNNASFNISGSSLRANDSSTLAAGAYSVRIRSTDSGSATFEKVFSITVVDDLAPGAPSTPDLTSGSDSGSSSTDNVTNVTTPAFTGTAEAGSTVRVYWGGTNLMGATTADGSGNWSVTAGSALSAGSYSITAKATDTAGNTGSASAALALTIDTSAPAAPAFTGITNDTGTSSTDGITSDQTLVFHGTAEANSTVTVIRVGSGTIGTTTADGSGVWSFDYTGTTLASGDYTFRATAADAAGNTSASSTDFFVTVDANQPSPVTITAVSTDSGSSSTDGITNDQTLTLSGTAEAATRVTVTRSGVGALGSVTADGTGHWTFDYTGTALPEGSYLFTATSTDTAGNVSAVSADFPVTIDTTAPAAPAITAISDDTGSSSTDHITSDTTLTLSGTAEANAKVEVTRSGSGVLGTTTADGTGAWTYDYTGTTLATGTYIFTAKATDAAGNVSVASSDFTVQVQDAPTITTQPAGGTYVAGGTITLSVTAGGTGPFTYQWYLDGTLLGDGSNRSGSTTATLTETGIGTVGFSGTYTVVVTNLAGSVTSSGAVVTVNKADQTITFPAIADKLTTDAPFALNATATSGFTVSFQVLSGPATLTGSTVTVTGAGSVTIRASQAGDLNTNAAPAIDRSFAVNKALASVTLNGLSATYDGSAKQISVTTAPANLSVSVSYAGSSTAPTNAGSYTVVATIDDATYAGSASGTFTIASADQTITFAQPANASVGTPLSLSATATSGLPVSFTVVSGLGSIVGGNQLVASRSGSITVRATQAGSVNFNAAPAVDRTVTAIATAPEITAQPASGVARVGDSFTFSVTARGDELAYQWTFDGSPIAGATSTSLTLSPVQTSQQGSYAVVVSNSTASVTSTAATLTVTPATAPAGGVYFGTFTQGGDFAVYIGKDGVGFFAGYLPSWTTGYYATFTLDANGDFTAAVDESRAAGAARNTANAPAVAADAKQDGSGPGTGPIKADSATRTLRGHASGGVFTASIDEASLNFSAGVQSPDGPTAGIAGFYSARAEGTATGASYAVANARNEVFVLTVSPTGPLGATGIVDAAGSFQVAAASATFTGELIEAPREITLDVAPVDGGAAQRYSGVRVDVVSNNRLINLSSRLRAGSGSQTFISGFIIQGDTPKTVLIRGVGPTLAKYGVPGVLAQPRLQLYRGSTRIAVAGPWGEQANAADIVSTSERLGTFAFEPGSQDSAMLQSLEPGAYTAMVSGAEGQSGVSLVEVYDASSAVGRLINISTRGYAGQGNDVIIAGFIVTGNVPKRVLLRVVGPGLAAYGVDGVLADPALRLFDASRTIIAENDDWDEGDAATATSAMAQVGAFPLAAGGKDAALVITLPPGAYTAHGYGKNNLTGVALVEVYELP